MSSRSSKRDSKEPPVEEAKREILTVMLPLSVHLNLQGSINFAYLELNSQNTRRQQEQEGKEAYY